MNERVRAILEEIANAPLSSFTLDVFRGAGTPSDRWSTSNRLIMVLSGTHDARGFRQWKEAGRWVKKGAKAIWILAPIEVKVKIPEADKNSDESAEEIRVLRGFRGIPVFAIEDTEGEPIPAPDFADYKIPAEFEGIVKELGIHVMAGAIDGEAYGWYVPQLKAIKIMSPDVEVFIHELCHAVDDKLNNLEGSKEEKEFIAELGAGILGGLLGYEVNRGNVREYLRGCGFTDLMQEVKLIERTLKVVEWIVQRTSREVEVPALL